MRKKEVYYHIIGWIVYILYIKIGLVLEPKVKPFNVQLYNYTFALVKFIEFYFLYLFVYPLYVQRRSIPLLIAGIIMAIAIFTGTRFLTEEVIVFYFFHFHNYFGYTPLSYSLDNTYFASSGIIISFFVYSSFKTLYQEKENKSLREEKMQAELAFLKTQINPHFLYNTLNYIYSMAYPVSDELANAVIKLSQLMRYMLTESANETVDLQKEVEYIENYISIYQMRFADAFFVDFKQTGSFAGQRIASLVLVPFVENAFKHGVTQDPTRPITIKLNVTANRLSFTVSNQINQQQKDHSTGVGLPNIRRRLELIYPGRHELLIANNSITYKSTLNIML